MTTHEEQRKAWDAEHAKPNVLLQMDSDRPSGGVVKFWEYLREFPHERGVEMGCGKGRNVIWLAAQGVRMSGFDVSPIAIDEARRRAIASGAKERVDLRAADATEEWPYAPDTFDFGIDCFASTDIEDPALRARAASEMRRVLKPGGRVLAYLLSPEDEFHAEMIRTSPANEANAFVHATGKFEKTFSEEEARALYGDFRPVRIERFEKTAEFGGRSYDCRHVWAVFEK